MSVRSVSCLSPRLLHRLGTYVGPQPRARTISKMMTPTMTITLIADSQNSNLPKTLTLTKLIRRIRTSMIEMKTAGFTISPTQNCVISQNVHMSKESKGTHLHNQRCGCQLVRCGQKIFEPVHIPGSKAECWINKSSCVTAESMG